ARAEEETRGAASRSEGARRSRRRTEKEPQGEGDVRRLQPEPSSRVRRVDHRGETRSDACTAHRDGDRVARRRQVATLEIPELLSDARRFSARAAARANLRRCVRRHAIALEIEMIRKLKSGEYRLYSRKTDPKTGKRRNLGTFASRAAAEKHERAVQYFKRH